MIEIVLDTETTGLNVKDGHRIIEIGCIELKDQKQTSKKLICTLSQVLLSLQNVQNIMKYMNI